jgi:hypothetical protein
VRTGRSVLAALAALLALAAVPASASAAVSITSFTITPASTQAGSNPDVTTDATFSNAGGDTVKDATLTLAPGLLANPTAPTTCQSSDFQHDRCPGSSRVGDGTITATAPAFGTTVTLPVSIYVVAPQGGELARIGLIVDFFNYPAARVTAPVQLRTAPDVGLNIPLTDIPNQVSNVGIAIDELRLRLFGTVNGQPFTRLPTSCAPAHTGLSVDSYGAPSTAVTATAAFTPTGCGSLSYNPHLTAAATLDSGDNGVALDSTITESAGDAATVSAALGLPAGLAPRLSALQAACSANDLSSCPAVGSATVSTPLLTSPLTGKLVLAAHAGSLPTLDAVFPPPFAIVLPATASLSSGGLRTSFGGIPDIPITSLEVKLSGGPSSILTAGSGLCTQPQTLSAVFGAQSGASASLTPALSVTGCGPAAATHHPGHRRHHKHKRHRRR